MDDVRDLYLQCQQNNPQSPDQETMEVPMMNDFTFDVTAMFNESEVSFNSISKVEDEPNDFTFDVTSMFNKSEIISDDETGDQNKDISGQILDTQTTTDSSKIADDMPEMEPVLSCEEDGSGSNEDVIYADEFEIDHDEEVDLDSVQEKAHSSKFLKELKTLHFNCQTKHSVAAIAYLCHMNCKPYIAPASNNEKYKLMPDRPVIRELGRNEVLAFYNSSPKSAVASPSSDCDRTASSKRTLRSHSKLQAQKASSDVLLTKELSRVIENEVIFNADDCERLTQTQMKEIVGKTEIFVQNIFRKIYQNRCCERRKRKRKGIRGICNSLLGEKQLKEDFKGELLHRRPKWSVGCKKQQCYKKELALNSQIDLLGKSGVRRMYYSKNKLLKDMR